jgi:wobble nucleotide-excising tRNase
MYGGNGSGKTTLARVIDKCSNYENCEINWYNNKVDTLVYNQNFIDENFYDKDSISGVFTLGKNDGDIIKEIQKLNIKKVEYLETIRKFIGTQTKLKTDIDNKTDIYRNLSWQLVKEYKSVFKESMRGYLNDKDKFFRMILKQDDNKSNLLTREELLKKYESIHSKKVEKINLIELIDLEYIKDLENFRLLCEPITGKIDLSMITLIDKLQNYDWIIKGIQYFTNSNEQCPFCQQSINEELKNTLFNIIDENYEKQINHIKNFKIDYEKKINKLINNLTNIINEYNKFINKDILSKIVIIKNIINLNIVKLEKKISNPSEIIKLETMLNVIVETNNLIMSANSKIEENNLYYNDITRYKEELRNEVWQYIYTQKKDKIDLYKKEYQNYTKANESIERKKLENYELVAEIKNKINEYEKKVTNINYTATEINKILAMFGFDNFMLKVVKQDNAYRIARNNGENAINTLSEGERRFLTFVYFYHLINGNTDNKDIVRDKVIVIDDPISSLDSDILFIVSILS